MIAKTPSPSVHGARQARRLTVSNLLVENDGAYFIGAVRGNWQPTARRYQQLLPIIGN